MEDYESALTQIKELLKERSQGLTVGEVAKAININRNSVAKYLDVLYISGHVEMRTIGPAKVYVPTRRMPMSSVLDLSADSIVILDQTLKIIQVNANFLSALGKTPHEVLGQPVRELKALPLTSESVVSQLETALNGTPFTGNVVVERGDEKFTYRVRLVPAAVDNGRRVLTCILEDITEHQRAQESLRRSEERFRTLIETSPSGVAILELDATLSFVSNRFAEMLGYTSNDDLVGQSGFAILIPEERERGLEHLAQLAEGKKLKSVPLTLLCRNGSRISVEVSASVMYDAAGNKEAIVAVMREASAQPEKVEGVNISNENLPKP